MLRIARFELGAGFAVRLWLSDGAVVDVDLSSVLDQPAFAAVTADRRLFEQVRISPSGSALSWPGDLLVDTGRLLSDERTVYRQLGVSKDFLERTTWSSGAGVGWKMPPGYDDDGNWVGPGPNPEKSATGPGDADVDWPAVWAAVAERLAAHWTAGRGHLLTEDTLRLETVLALETSAVAPGRLRVEVPAPELAGGKLDLVVDAAERAVVELKYPRDSKTGISPDTMTFGELVRDFLRVAVVPAGDRWVVQLLGGRLVGYLAAACARYGLHWASTPGAAVHFPSGAVAALPKTATQAIGAAAVTGTVTGSCVLAAPVTPELTLYAYRVDQLPDDAAAGSAVATVAHAEVPATVTQPAPAAASRTGARNEILDAARAVVTRAGRPEFSVADVVAEMRRRDTRYAESTIRTMITSHLCAEATGPGVAAYRDLTRIGYGLYRFTDMTGASATP